MEWYHWFLLGILVYNIIGTIVYFATNEDYGVAEKFTIGILNILWLIAYLFGCIYRGIKNRFFIRAIIENRETNVRYYCERKYYNYFVFGFENDKFKGIERTAHKKEWKSLPPVTEEMIEKATRCCKYCKYNDKECTDDAPLCKHNCWGEVEEYDKFERK